MLIESGLDIRPSFAPLGFEYGDNMFGPEPELRRLDSIRPVLRNPDCSGPDPVYAIAMDVGRPRDRDELKKRNLLFGVVAYAAGRLGDEPVRSQGHVHKISCNSGWSAPEIFEIWCGRAYIYMQETVDDDPGRCFAIAARPGDRVIVPPSWAHAVISADSARPLIFGAWCDRDYGFVYDGVRSHCGLAWFPVLNDNCEITWVANPHYCVSAIEVRPPRHYEAFGLDPGFPLYAHLKSKPDAVEWVSKPQLKSHLWQDFEP